MWHLTFLVPTHAVLSLTSVCSFPSPYEADSWTCSVFTVHGHVSSFFFEVRQCSGLWGSRRVEGWKGRNASAMSTHVTGSDMRHDHYRVCFLPGSAGVLCLVRWHLPWLQDRFTAFLCLLDLTMHGQSPGTLCCGRQEFESPWRTISSFIVFIWKEWSLRKALCSRFPIL